MLARTVCRPRAFQAVAAGRLLPGGLPALAACTDTALQLLVAQEGAQDGEGQLEVVCDQPVLATVRAVAAVPAAAPGQQDCLALLTDSGFLSVLRFDAASCRFVVVQQLALPSEALDDPFHLLAVHPRGAALAVAGLGGTACLAARLGAPAPPGGAAGGDGALCFSQPAVLSLSGGLWSLEFAEDAQQAAAGGQPGSSAAARGQRFTLAALHQLPHGCDCVLVRYEWCSAGAAPQQGGSLEVTGVQLLPGSGLWGQPLALVPPPPQQAAGAAAGLAGRLLLREGAVELASGWGGAQSSGEAAALLAQLLAPPGGSEVASAQPAAAEEEGGCEAEPMALSQPQPSWMAVEHSTASESDGGQGGDADMAPAEPDAAAGPGQPLAAEEASSSASGGPAMRGGAPVAPLITACCWEWMPGSDGVDASGAAGDGSVSLVLVYALQDGRLCRLPAPASPGECGEALPPQPAAGQPGLGQPARALAALPGGLLAYCTDASGLQLLRLSSAQAGAAEVAAGGTQAALAAAAYEPLLPAHALAAAQLLPGWEAALGGAGCVTTPGAGALAACRAGDLERSGQRQLYAASQATGGGACRGGALCVLHPDPKPEAAFELPGAAEGITGLWGLRRAARDRHHSLALLSFVGGSRLLAVQGGIFRDVTEAHPLRSDRQTLAAGSLALGGPCLAVAQVTSQAVVTFDAAAPAAGRQGDSGEAWRPPPGSSIGAAAVAEAAVLLFCTGGASRHLVALLPAGPAAPAPAQASPPAAAEQPPAALAQAAALPVAAEVSCLSGLLLQGTQQQQQQQQQPQQQQASAVFAVGTYASTVLLVQLSWGGGQLGSPAALQLLRSIDLTATSAAASLPSAAPQPAACPLSPRSLQREQLTPESLLLLPAGRGGGAEPAGASVVVGLRTGGLLQLCCAWDDPQRQQQPQQQQLGQQRQQQQQQQGLQELLSVSLGHMPVVLLPLPQLPPAGPAGSAGVAAPAAVALSDRASLLHHHPPVAAAAAGPAAQACDGGGRVRCQPLALPGVQAAAALLLDGGGMGGSSAMLDALCAEAEAQHGAGQQPPQLFLLCAAADGCLRMVGLERSQLAAARCWPLPQQLQPAALALHSASGGVVVGGACAELERPTRGWRRQEEEPAGPVAAVQVVDPATGELLASYSSFLPGEAITALEVWDPTPAAEQPQQQQHADGGGAPADAAGVAMAAAEAVGGAAGEGGSGSLRSHPIAFSPESPAAAAAASVAAAAAAGDELPWGGFIVVGTSVSAGGDEGEGRWDDESGGTLQGRLLLLQLAAATSASAGTGRAAAWQEAAGWPAAAPPRRQLQLLTAAALHLPSRVLALCAGSTRLTGRPGEGAGAGAPRLFASVGRRLAAFEWRQRAGALRRVAWLPTNRPLAALQVSAGLLAAADRGEGCTLYRYFEPPPGSAAAALHAARGRLARRLRHGPPGAAELRARLGLQPAAAPPGGQPPGAAAAGAQAPPEEDDEPGFQVVAADAACRPAVGAVALPAAPGRGGAAGGPPAAAAAVLDARGRLALLQQRWPLHEPALHERCCFELGEPAVALLAGSLRHQGDAGAGEGAPFGGAAVAAGGAAAPEMAAVTGGGAVVALLPLPPQQAGQLAALQRALVAHPACAPLSGATQPGFRAGRPHPLFRHPPPPGAAEGAGALPPPSSPSTPAADEAGAGASLLVPLPQQRDARPGSAAAAAAWDATGSAPSTPRSPLAPPAQHAAEQPGQLDVVLDGDLLQLFLLLPPAEQRGLVAAAGLDAGSGGAAAAQLASRLSDLVAQLLM